MRKPFQGVGNVVRFNWHYYIFAAIAVLFFAIISQFLPTNFKYFSLIISFGIILTTLSSLIAAYYIYDLAGFYDFKWLEESVPSEISEIVNINAGFDETSEILKTKFNESNLHVFDFYDPENHTEISIERARKAYPPYPDTKKIQTTKLDLTDNSVDRIFLTFAVHEIRKESEKLAFFSELNRVLKSDGLIYVTEHLRDFPNFIAFNIGFLHFFSKSSWRKVFSETGFVISKEIPFTSFVTIFILEKDGNSS